MFNLKNRFSRRTVAFFWLMLLSVIVGILIYAEQIALLYVLATLSLVILLTIVGFADLEHIGTSADSGFGSSE